MPATVSNRNTPSDFAMQGVTGALSGKLAGEEFAEQRRLNNVQIQQQARQFDASEAEKAREVDQAHLEGARQFDKGLQEGARQFNAENAFKHLTLVHAATQGRLGRDHEKRIEVLRQGSETFRELERLATSRRNVDEQEQTQRYGIRKGHEQFMSNLDVVRSAQLQDASSKLTFAQTMRSTYGDPATYTPEVWAEIDQAAYETFLGSGATTGQEGVVQATEAQKKQLRDDVRNRVTNYESHRSKLTTDATELLDAQLTTQAKFDPQLKTAADGVGVDGGTPLHKLLSGPPDPRTKTRTLDPGFVARSLSPDQQATLNELEMRLEEQAASVSIGLTKDMDPILAETIAKSYAEENDRILQDSFDGPEWASAHPSTKKALRDYYASQAESLGNYYGNAVFAPPPAEEEKGD